MKIRVVRVVGGRLREQVLKEDFKKWVYKTRKLTIDADNIGKMMRNLHRDLDPRRLPYRGYADKIYEGFVLLDESSPTS